MTAPTRWSAANSGSTCTSSGRRRSSPGRPRHPARPPSDDAFGFVRLSAAPGIVDQAPATREIPARPGVVTVERERRTRGARTGRPVSFAVFRAVLTGTDETQVAQRAQDLTAWFHQRTDQILQCGPG
ncbi:hypothetical protein [Streptomyces achromogenes]|uniref:hypothetical protein n=1 Tax=Streptomyces achromogenes TaxID=67255 RepID=UPI0036F8E901